MRLFIVFLSVIIFLISGFITYRALEIPGYDFSYKHTQNLSVPDPSAPLDNAAQSIKDKPGSDPQARPLQKVEYAGQVLAQEQQDEGRRLERSQAVNTVVQGVSARRQDAGNQEKIIAVLGGGTFRSGQVVVSDSFTKSINELLSTISEYPGHNVVIEGHTDNIPISATAGQQFRDNMDLSYLRAKAIARVLIENGIARNRISVVGYGDMRPVASNNTDEGRAINRRVEIKLVPVQTER